MLPAGFQGTDTQSDRLFGLPGARGHIWKLYLAPSESICSLKLGCSCRDHSQPRQGKGTEGTGCWPASLSNLFFTCFPLNLIHLTLPQAWAVLATIPPCR